MSEPEEHDKPEDTPGGRPETPPGQEGEQPGNRPDVPPGQEEKPEEGEPTHPMVDPDAPHVDPRAAVSATVEALLGYRDFLAVAPRRRSAASTAAAQAALSRWMRLHGHDTNGFYPMAQWQEFYTATLAYTGR